MRRRLNSPGSRDSVAGIVTRNPREAVGIIIASGAFMIICANALFMQPGPHPAPIFAPKPASLAPALLSPPPYLPPPAPARVETPARPRAQIVGDIQRELAKRHFYEGAIDGVWGAKTDAAARDFAQAIPLRTSIEPGEDLLRAIAGAPIPAARPAAQAEPPRTDPIAQLLAPGKRVLAAQRILSGYGYGQIKPTGALDPPTQDAIRKFEGSHKMPVTGLLSDQLVRALSEMSGQPID